MESKGHCGNCGKSVVDFASRERKFCSPQCYWESRRDGRNHDLAKEPCPKCGGSMSRRSVHCRVCFDSPKKQRHPIDINPPITETELAAESWSPVAGFELYEISDLGRVRRGGRYIRFYRSDADYPKVKLHNGGKCFDRYVHRLVLLTFGPPCPPGHECAHWDGNRANPRLTNLRWATRVNNMRDKKRHGTERFGEKSHMARINEETVRTIRRRADSGEKFSDIARTIPLSRAQIARIAQRKRWSHVV
jgi:endogenous inhibitor of DNA gyrase (YacG/DUF329 family)